MPPSFLNLERIYYYIGFSVALAAENLSPSFLCSPKMGLTFLFGWVLFVGLELLEYYEQSTILFYEYAVLFY